MNPENARTLAKTILTLAFFGLLAFGLYLQAKIETHPAVGPAPAASVSTSQP